MFGPYQDSNFKKLIIKWHLWEREIWIWIGYKMIIITVNFVKCDNSIVVKKYILIPIPYAPQNTDRLMRKEKVGERSVLGRKDKKFYTQCSGRQRTRYRCIRSLQIQTWSSEEMSKLERDLEIVHTDDFQEQNLGIRVIFTRKGQDKAGSKA